LGLHDWTYDRIECGADELPGIIGGFGPEWVGVSVTNARQVSPRCGSPMSTPLGPSRWDRPTPWCARRVAGGPTTPTSTGLAAPWRQ